MATTRVVVVDAVVGVTIVVVGSGTVVVVELAGGATVATGGLNRVVSGAVAIVVGRVVVVPRAVVVVTGSVVPGGAAVVGGAVVGGTVVAVPCGGGAVVVGIEAAMADIFTESAPHGPDGDSADPEGVPAGSRGFDPRHPSRAPRTGKEVPKVSGYLLPEDLPT